MGPRLGDGGCLIEDVERFQASARIRQPIGPMNSTCACVRPPARTCVYTRKVMGSLRNVKLRMRDFRIFWRMERTRKPFREALAEQMRQRKLQQLELAVRSDVSEAAISLYLSGRRQPRMATIEKLARGLELPPDYFAEWRAARAKALIESAMAQGLVELEDVELILERRRAGVAADDV